MLRLGVHPNNLHLRLARLAATGEIAGDFRWFDYLDGRATGDLIRSSRIDVGGTGSTPPLTAQADGVDLVYLAASAPRPANGAVLVREASDLQATADLSGRRIALIDGSFHTALLAALAERDGFDLASCTPVDLPPAASAAALRAGDVDAWVAMDPHLRLEAGRGDLRALPETGGLIPNRSLFWASREAAVERPAAIAAALRLLSRVAAGIGTSPDEPARRLAADGEADEAHWRAVLVSRDWTIHPVGPAVLAEQQREADLLARHGALPRRIAVAEAAPPVPFPFAA